jgi:transcriptional regulator GlxA family with amidase domain
MLDERLNMNVHCDRDSTLPKIKHPGIHRVRQYLDQCYADPTTVTDLARIACLSESQFQAVFRRQTKVTPMKYLRGLRIEAAKKLLARGYGIDETAYRAGFESLRSFQRAFSTLARSTPSTYRNQVRDHIVHA